MYYWLFSGGTAACRDRDDSGRIDNNCHFNDLINAGFVDINVILSFPCCFAACRAEVKLEISICKRIGLDGSVGGYQEVCCEAHCLHGLNAGPLMFALVRYANTVL